MTDDEKSNCLNKFNGTKVDYILSHNGRSRGIALTDSRFENEDNLTLFQKDSTVNFNDKIDAVVEYEKWFFGHWHTDVGGGMRILGRVCGIVIGMGFVFKRRYLFNLQKYRLIPSNHSIRLLN